MNFIERIFPCLRKKKKPFEHKTNQPAPTFRIVEFKVDRGTTPATREELEAVLNATAEKWREHYASRPGGIFPPTWPTGEQEARVWIRHTDANSADGSWEGRGRFGWWLKGWSKTHGRPKSPPFQKSALCHALCHTLSGQGGNHGHALFSQVAGC